MVKKFLKIARREIRKCIDSFMLLFFEQGKICRVNLCSGHQKIPSYFNVDCAGDVDLRIDLNKRTLPFRDNSLEVVICISAINYFTLCRSEMLVRDIFRVLAPGGVVRIGVQDLELIAKKYVDKDTGFFFQRLPNGQERFEGVTLGDKFAAWFYGYETSGNGCKYFFDYDSLARLFVDAGFSIVERMEFQKSRLSYIELIDNRPDQMFFLEAVK